MSVALAPYQDTAQNVRNLLVLTAATLAALATIVTVLLAFRRWVSHTAAWKWFARKGAWLLLKLWTEPRQEERAEKQRKDDAHIMALFNEAQAPLALQVAEIAHSTNGKPVGAKTMSDEVSALIGKVDTIGELLSELVGRVGKLEGNHHEPHPATSAAHPSQHRRHDDT